MSQLECFAWEVSVLLELRQGQANEFNYLSRLTSGMETISNPAQQFARFEDIARFGASGKLGKPFFLVQRKRQTG